MDCSLPGFSIHGTSQARILEWVAISFSRGSSQPRDWTHVSCGFCIGRQILYHWATWEASAPPQPKSLCFTRISHEPSSLTPRPPGVEQFQSCNFSSVSENAIPMFRFLGFPFPWHQPTSSSSATSYPLLFWNGEGSLWLLCDFLFSLSSHSWLALAGLGTVAQLELNINFPFWWGKLQLFGCSLSDPLLGKQHQVILDIGCALLTAGPDSPAWPLSCSLYLYLRVLFYDPVSSQELTSVLLLPPFSVAPAPLTHPTIIPFCSLPQTCCYAPWTTAVPDPIIMVSVLTPESQRYIWCPLFPLIS